MLRSRFSLLPLRRFVQSLTLLALLAVGARFPAMAGQPLMRPAGVNFSILPPPPGDDTPAGLADLNVLLYVQATRTPEMVDMAKKMAAPSVFSMNAAIFGPWFTRDNLPKTAAILREATKVTSPILTEAKAHWKRPRPYVRSARIAPVVGKPGDAGSYPSGHSFGIAVPEFILSEAFPQHAAALDAKVREVMWGRIVGGVHFPSDTEAGRLLGRAVVTEMAKTPAMREAIETIRKEAAPFISGEKTGLPAVLGPAKPGNADSTRPLEAPEVPDAVQDQVPAVPAPSSPQPGPPSGSPLPVAK